jgi:hypothetical protein
MFRTGREAAEIEALKELQWTRKRHAEAQEMHRMAERVEVKTQEHLTRLGKELRRISGT